MYRPAYLGRQTILKQKISLRLGRVIFITTDPTDSTNLLTSREW